jgi:regulator of replication initiation timing
MSQKEINRYAIIKRLINQEINGTEATHLLKLSVRQIKRLKAKVKKQGPPGLIHGNRGRQSHNQIPPKEKAKIISLLHNRYSDFKPTLASEKLEENHHLNRDPKTIRQIMIEQKLWQPKKKKQPEHRQWRQRKTFFGEMQQFDGSYEYWLEERGPYCCLQLAVDDAKGEITHGRFDSDEGVFPTFAFWQEYLRKNGKPVSIYLDQFSTYKMTQKVAQENHDTKTQFQRAMAELSIELITAYSPQAKGRVERIFKTLQDRLIKEMRLKNISTIKEANLFLQNDFIPWYNQRFAVEAKGKANLHQALTKKEEEQLDHIFTRQKERTVQNDFTISFQKQWHQLTKEQPVTICKQDKVMVEENQIGQIQIRLRGKYLNHQPIPKRPKDKKTIPWVLPATIKQPSLQTVKV